MGMYNNILAALGDRGLMPQGVLSTMDAQPQQEQPSDAYQTPEPSMMMAQAPQAAPQVPQAPQGGALSRFIGAGASDDFNRALLAAGAGLLSRPGAQGLGAAAQNVGSVMDDRQKRLDDTALKQAKIDKMRADISRGQMPKITNMGNGMVMITPADGSPSYTMTDAEFRSAKFDQMGAQTAQANAKTAELQDKLKNGDWVKVGEKDGRVLLMNKKNREVQEFTSEDYQKAARFENDAKTERAKILKQYGYDNQPLTAAEQKLGDERRTELASIDTNIGKVKDVMDYASKIKPGVGSQLAGTGVGRSVANLASGFSDSAAEAANFQQKLRDILTIDWLDLGQKLKGSLSDKEGAQLKSSQPDPTADYNKVIKPWLEKFNKWLTKSKAEAEAAVGRERKVGNGSTPSNVTTGSQGAGASLPQEALSVLEEGMATTFGNGQVWTLENGKPKRIK